MDTLEQLIQQKDYKGLVSACEELEFHVAIGRIDVPLNTLYSFLFAGYLLTNELNASRFLWKRLSTDLKEDSELRNFHRIFVSLWKREYPTVYEEITRSSWTNPLLVQLNQELMTIIRERMFGLISTAYSHISIADTSRYLGVPEADLPSSLQPRGWEMTENGFIPKQIEKKVEQTTGLEQLDQLAGYVMYLESSV
ncbi:hypothetical protein K7432_000398 [Basidiobolus ranarum]|uniref:CSN8/PSMD8/EIF3K domain-containing protein n=1 Tax=Basidiobolus ranarum TaxID=34480 RepID=A0ABR2X4K4_9FUNG